MGNAFSSIARAVRALNTGLGLLRALSKDYSEVLARARSSPGLPVADPTAPYWLDDPPYPELTDMRSPEAPPDEADVVIVGSGIAGAAAARSVLHEASRRRTGAKVPPPPRVVVLEARQICSGATGRNGGHVKASPHEDFALLRRVLPEARAAELVRFQLRHLDVLRALCLAEGIDVAECRKVETVDFFVDEEAFTTAANQVEELRKWVPEFRMWVWSAEEAREVFQPNHLVVGAISFEAGAIWPYRFVTSIWRKLLDEFPESLSIETGTPVTGIDTNSADPEHPFSITTSRGIIRSRHVVHTTNSFASHLVPGLRGKMTGLLAHMSSQRPGKDFPDLDGQRSWSIFYGSRGFDYVTQRPTADGVPGDILLGGGFGQSSKQGLDHVGVYDDSSLDALTVAHNLAIMPTLFEPRWGPESAGKPRKVWSGVVAATADARPFVGRLDARITERKVPGAGKTSDVGHGAVEPGEWTAAGFMGNGMVWAWLSGTAVGIMLAGSENEDVDWSPGRPQGKLREWFPDDLLPTYDRIKKIDIEDLAGLLFD